MKDADAPKWRKSKRRFDAEPVLPDDHPIAKEIIARAKETTNDPVTGKPDALVQAIERWAPLVLQFVQGFAANAQQSRPQGQEAPKVQAPPGWTGMTPLQRLNMKHRNPAWYEAGLAYEAGLPPSAAPKPAPALVDRSSELPVVDARQPPAQPEPQPVVEKEKEEPQVTQEPPRPPTPEEQADALLDMLAAKVEGSDVNKLLEQAARPKDELQKLAESYKDFIAPIVARAMLRREWTTPDKTGFLDVVREKAPKAVKALDDEALLPKLGEIYDEMRKAVR